MRGAVTPNSPTTVGQLHPTAKQALAYDLRPAATLVPEQPDEIVLRHVQRFIRQQHGPREGAVGHATFGVMSCLLRRQSADTGDGRRDNPGRPFGLKARALNGYFPGPLSAKCVSDSRCSKDARVRTCRRTRRCLRPSLARPRPSEGAATQGWAEPDRRTRPWVQPSTGG